MSKKRSKAMGSHRQAVVSRPTDIPVPASIVEHRNPTCPRLPGRNFDPKNTIGGTIDRGWKVVMWACAPCAVLGAMIAAANYFKVDLFGLKGNSHWTNVCLVVAVGLSVLNIFSWASGPREDMKDLRYWIRPEKALFPINDMERRTIWVQMAIVTSLCVMPFFGPFYFGLMGMLIYAVNFLGFRRIQKKVKRGVTETRAIYCGENPIEPKIRDAFGDALKCIADYWGVSPEKGRWFRQNHQLRHGLLTVMFATVAVLGWMGQYGHHDDEWYKTMAFIVGGATVIIALVSITWFRSLRQDRLNTIYENLPRLIQEQLDMGYETKE